MNLCSVLMKEYLGTSMELETLIDVLHRRRDLPGADPGSLVGVVVDAAQTGR